jgi:hypothetical protein
MDGVEDEDGLIDEEAQDEVENGSREVKKMHEPRLPSKEEREMHAMTHVPFRSWCAHCVRGRGEEMPHHRTKEVPEQMEVHMDFCFPGDGDDRRLTILVVRERVTRMTMCAVAPGKTTGEFLAKWVVAFLREIGGVAGDITVKTDQEPAMISLVREVARHRAAAGGE